MRQLTIALAGASLTVAPAWAAASAHETYSGYIRCSSQAMVAKIISQTIPRRPDGRPNAMSAEGITVVIATPDEYQTMSDRWEAAAIALSVVDENAVNHDVADALGQIQHDLDSATDRNRELVSIFDDLDGCKRDLPASTR